MVNESWQCNGCKHVFHIPESYATTLIEHGCAFCGSQSFALYELLRELDCA